MAGNMLRLVLSNGCPLSWVSVMFKRHCLSEHKSFQGNTIREFDLLFAFYVVIPTFTYLTCF